MSGARSEPVGNRKGTAFDAGPWLPAGTARNPCAGEAADLQRKRLQQV